ncbi:MAG: hypothetical protein U0452_11405 [Anaerolineae bacterium]
MRFFMSDGPPPSLDDLAAMVAASNPPGMLARDAAEPARGDLFFGDVLYAEIEVNAPGDEIFEEDRLDLLDELAKQDDPNAAEAVDAVRWATGAVVLRVYEPGHDDWPRLNLIVDWLFDTRAGLLQVDEEGFFDRTGRKIVALL